jgi:hypothetical protein
MLPAPALARYDGVWMTIRLWPVEFLGHFRRVAEFLFDFLLPGTPPVTQTRRDGVRAFIGW